MPYTPPSGTAVNFSFSHHPYTPPSGTGVNLAFGAGGGGSPGSGLQYSVTVTVS